MYRVFVESHFTAAHRLRGYEGQCGRLHGHTWKVRVEVESGRVDAIGISLDFKELKSLVDAPLEKLDHYHINEIPPFDAENPTAENLSRFIYREVKSRLPEGVTVTSVTVWESEKYGVAYSEP
ncbi:MAG: 6-carboxytetrahydropterin synthase QueD [bacterium]|nr:6-carboxytetrahydropterin synthase QueD [bacterium]